MNVSNVKTSAVDLKINVTLEQLLDIGFKPVQIKKRIHIKSGHVLYEVTLRRNNETRKRVITESLYNEVSSVLWQLINS